MSFQFIFVRSSSICTHANRSLSQFHPHENYASTPKVDLQTSMPFPDFLSETSPVSLSLLPLPASTSVAGIAPDTKYDTTVKFTRRESSRSGWRSVVVFKGCQIVPAQQDKTSPIMSLHLVPVTSPTQTPTPQGVDLVASRTSCWQP